MGGPRSSRSQQLVARLVLLVVLIICACRVGEEDSNELPGVEPRRKHQVPARRTR